MLEKIVEIGLLFDFYGSLITERQQQIIGLYYSQDLSLGEIAERLNISRQGVYDHLQRGEDSLYGYEKKLGLVERFNKLRTRIKQLEEYIQTRDIEEDLKKELIIRVGEIRESL